jgi:hypothetical protein
MAKVTGSDATYVHNVPEFYTDFVDPTPDDDSRFGNNVGDEWINTDTRAVFKCIYNREGAAIWSVIVKPTSLPRPPGWVGEWPPPADPSAAAAEPGIRRARRLQALGQTAETAGHLPVDPVVDPDHQAAASATNPPPQRRALHRQGQP